MAVTRGSAAASGSRLAAMAVHAYTAAGSIVALLALRAVLEREVRLAFLWLTAAVLIDASDGTLARRAKVKVAAPSIDGGRLDDIVDYLTYVFVPVVLLSEWGLLPEPGALPIAACALVASAFGFARTDAKTADYFFTGFPSYWNVVALYLYLTDSPPWLCGLVVVVLSLLVFVPIRYVYPSRTPTLRAVTVGLGALWGAALLVLVWRLPARSPLLLAISALYPVYYVALSLWLTRRRSRRPHGVRSFL